MWSLWWTKRHWDRFSPRTSVSPTNHSTNFSIIIITRGWHIGLLVAAVPSGPNCTPPFELIKQPQRRAIAQAVSRRFPTAVALVQCQVRSCGICGGQSGIGVCFLRVLEFPLPILNPPNAPHPLSSGAGTVGQIVADLPSGLSPLPHEIKKIPKVTT
jgi:hypothetical protein